MTDPSYRLLVGNLHINFFHLGFLVDSDHHEDEWWQEAEHKLKLSHKNESCKSAKNLPKMSHTWNDQNLGCDIGENLLKHMAWQPGWLVSHRNTPLIICFVTVTWYESYRWRNNYLFVTIDLWSDHQDNKSAKDEINRPPKIISIICHLWRHYDVMSQSWWVTYQQWDTGVEYFSSFVDHVVNIASADILK